MRRRRSVPKSPAGVRAQRRAYASALVSGRTAAGWSGPVVAPCSGHWHDMEPAFAPDGRWLVFVSDRPSHAGGPPLRGHYRGGEHPGGHLWRVERIGDRWSMPQPLPATVMRAMRPSRQGAADGGLHFMHPDPATGKFRLSRPQSHDGACDPPQPLPFGDHGERRGPRSGAGRVVHRVRLRSPRGAGLDLFIAWREHGRWSAPVWMASRVSPGSNAEGRLSPDHRTLYFSRERLAGDAGGDHPARDNGRYNLRQLPLAPWPRPDRGAPASPPAGLARVLPR